MRAGAVRSAGLWSVCKPLVPARPQEYRASKVEKKANPFEVMVKKVELPTAPPGGVFEASCSMSALLGGFEVDLNCKVKTTEDGFQAGPLDRGAEGGYPEGIARFDRSAELQPQTQT